MASCRLNRFERPKKLKAESPPFCWVIMSAKGESVYAPEGILPIFEEWQDARKFADQEKGTIGRCRLKLFFWSDIVLKFKNIATEAELDCKNGYLISLPLEL
jgi:hypothetical protein